MRQPTDHSEIRAPTATTAAASSPGHRDGPRTTAGFAAVAALSVAAVAGAMVPVAAASVAVVVGVTVLAAAAGRRAARRVDQPPDETGSVRTPAAPTAD